MRKLFTRRAILLNLGLLVVLGAIVAVVVVSLRGSGASAAPGRAVAASVGNVTSTVSATGTVQSATAIGVNFTTGGQLTDVLVKEGDAVTQGQPLARIDARDANEALKKAQVQLAQTKANASSASAGLASAQAKLAQDRQGPTAAQLQRDAVAATQAQAQLDQANQSLDLTQQILAQNGVGYKNAIDKAASQINKDNVALQNAIVNLNAVRNNTSLNQTNTGQTTQAFQNQLQSAQDAVTAAQNVVDNDRQVYNDAVQAQTAGVLRDQQTLEQAKNAVNSAQLGLQSTLAANQLNEQPPTAAQIASDQAAIQNAQANIAGQAASIQTAQIAVDDAQRVVDETVLTAPIAGTITSVADKAGEFVGGGGGASASTSAFIQIVDLNGLQVTADFAEVDAAKVKVGQQANVTVDALPGEAMTAHVASIASLSKTTAGVVSYTVTLSLDRPGAGVKVGQSASAQVTVNTHPNVVEVPSSAVTTARGVSTVTIRGADGKDTITPVTIGLVGDSTTEITTGLKAGDQVVLPNATGGNARTVNGIRIPAGINIGGGGGFGGGGRGG